MPKVTVEPQGAVFEITLNRPDVLNAVDRETIAALAAGPTEAYARTKALLQATIGDAFEAQLRREAKNFAACAATDDFAEGVRAFLEKRRPNFSGCG